MCWDAGVEKIVDVLSGMGMLLGSRIATLVFASAIRCPMDVCWLLAGVCSCGAWWFENWIVDASK